MNRRERQLTNVVDGARSSSSPNCSTTYRLTATRNVVGAADAIEQQVSPVQPEGVFAAKLERSVWRRLGPLPMMKQRFPV